ncbi:CdaR family protein [Enterococcus mediterraneensis]|uniref:CdaR family protein n=1 Tax=Enterococcus mediterraneensis TaxID=2364791 RepID=UPI000F06A3BF|nr:CdaR family protein [Enterococcus mediterraneensis]
MSSKESKGSVLYAVLALLFSLVLFFNVNGNNNLTASLTSTPEAYEEDATNVPVHLIYESSKYYIHGYEPTVKVKLKSANRIQLNSEANEDTRSFRVIADLSNLSEGTHEVKLRVNGLSSAVTASVDPGTVTVTIEKKVTKTFEVEPVVSSANLEEGYQIEKVSVDPKEVDITTGDKTLELIDRVVATVDPEKVASKDVEETVDVQALDEKGNSLSIQAEPAKVDVQVGLTAPEKTVGLYAAQVGKLPSGVSGYTFSLSQLTAKLRGPLSDINNTNNIGIPVDITGIREATTKTVEIPVDDGHQIDPKTVSVHIVPIMIESDETTERTENTPASTSQPASSQESTSVADRSEESSQTTTQESQETQETTNDNN